MQPIDAYEDQEIDTRVLVVEDSPTYSEMLCGFLGDKDMTCVPAASLADARQALDDQGFDFILLDHYLPDGIGVDFLDTLLVKGIDIPVMMITGDDEQSLKEECFDRGVTDFMPKPIDLQLLLLKMQRLMETYRLQQRVQTQKNHLQQLLTEKQIEEDLARHVYEHISTQDTGHTEYIKSLLQASSAFNGDLLLSRTAPSGNVFVMLVDATGHGLAAAISILPLVSIFRAMVSKGYPLSMLVHEMNAKLTEGTPGDRFVAGIGLEIDLNRNVIDIWSGGMPDILLFSKQGRLLKHIKSQHMPLGVLEGNQFDASLLTIQMHQGGHLYMFSDGIIEQESAQGEQFGLDRLISAVECADEITSSIPNVEKSLKEFSDTTEYQDDVSVVHVDLCRLLEINRNNPVEVTQQEGVWSFQLSLAGSQLIQMDSLSCIDNALKSSGMALETRRKLFTISAELLSNAIDHGVLGLDSALKNDADGFVVYLELREKRAAELTSAGKVQLNIEWTLPDNQVRVVVQDSGEGYEYKDTPPSKSDLSGRGLALVRALSDSFECPSPGNQTIVTLR